MEYDFMRRFEPERYTIRTFRYWVVLLRKRQVTLGSVIVALRRQVTSFSMVSSEEFAELSEVFLWYETTVMKLYGAEKFNYIVAMMKDNFVHFHAFPRYKGVVIRHNLEWQDIYWPGAVEMAPVTTERFQLDQIYSDFISENS